MNFSVRIRRMFGDVTLRDGGDEFLAQIFRHALDVGDPGRAQPLGKTFCTTVNGIFWSEFNAE